MADSTIEQDDPELLPGTPAERETSASTACR